jgi:anaerobic magnesium-protoporphyrin IX monomethyl ester cyclase
MNEKHIAQVGSGSQFEEGNLLLDESELEVKKEKAVRRKFSNMTKTVILIRPNPDDWTEIDRIRVGTPNSLMAISSVLREANIPVEIVDFSVLSKEEEIVAIDSLANRDDILLVGFTLMSVQVRHCLQIAKRIKEGNSDTKIIIGGIHAVLYPEETCRHELIDYVCYADGEEMMIDLAEFLYNKQEGDPTHIPALLYKKDGVVQKNPVGELPVIDHLPYSPFDLLDIDKYIHRSWHPTDPSHATRYFDILTGKGCPFRCTFCINALEDFYDREYRGMSAERILDEIEYLMEKYDAKHFKFVDELFFVNRKRLHSFLDGVEERNLKFTWTGNIRADYFTRNYVNSKMLKRIKDSGCVFLTMGTESGSQRMLDFMKKDLKIESVIVAATALDKIGITGGFSFMYGLPSETNEDIKATFKLIEKIYGIHPDIYIFGPQIFRPYPGNSLYDLCVEKGFPDKKNLEDWNTTHERVWGFSKSEDYKWVDNPKDLPYLGFYGKLAYFGINKGSGFLMGKIQKSLSVIAKWRFKYDIYAFPIEYFLFTKIMPIVQLLRWTSLSCQSGGKGKYHPDSVKYSSETM